MLRNSGKSGERRGAKAVEFVEGFGTMLAQGQQSTHLSNILSPAEVTRRYLGEIRTAIYVTS